MTFYWKADIEISTLEGLLYNICRSIHRLLTSLILALNYKKVCVENRLKIITESADEMSIRFQYLYIQLDVIDATTQAFQT